jgi:Domain of unknown function (DUF4158)
VTDEGGYGRFGALSRQELERYCYLDDEDRRLIAARRRDYNCLGFAVQVVNWCPPTTPNSTASG